MPRPGRSLPLLPVGLFLLLLGAAWWSIEASGYLPRFVTLAGALLLILFVVQRGPELRFLLWQARTHAEPGPTTTMLIAAVVLGLAAVLVGRVAPGIDLTRERLHSLGPASRATLAMVRAPLRLDGFFVEPSPEWDLAQRYLDLYQRSSPRVRTTLRDPDRDPAAASQAGVSRPGVIAISLGAARTQVFGLDEESITQGILRVLEGRARRVGFTQGHGEPLPGTGGETGVTAWAQALREGNIESEPVNLLEHADVPTGFDALLIVHPRHPFYPEETSALRRYLQQGGRVGLWVEPEDSTGLEQFLQFYYLTLLPGVIRDEGRVSSRLGMGPWAVALVGAPEHPITVGLNTFAVATSARGLRIESPHPMDLTIEPVLKTTGAVAVFPDPQATERAPLRRDVEVVAAALEWETATGENWTARADVAGLPPVKPAARLLVTGDASLVTNRFLGIGANRELASQSVQWLTSQERFLGLPPRRAPSAALHLDRAGLRALLYGIEFGLPLLLVLGGVVVWMTRRERGGR
jgi:hypothetical protein